ncbi:MAG: hypothetical protein IT449_04930 [Phycisphaerales bacterium]|nr:hypothetical protein [Phycisphaerales bacterium]
MRELRGWAVLAGTMSLGVACADIAAADVIAASTFDEDSEGWGIFFRGNRFSPQYIRDGGNPGGYVSGDDSRIGQRWFWEAPADFLGDISVAYGHELSFDLISIPGKGLPDSLPLTQQDVVLTRGDTTLTYNDPQAPGRAWTEFHVGLGEAGWLNETSGLPATREDMEFVLGGLEQLMLRGDYTGGDQVGGLDNVVLTPEPATGMLALLGIGALMRRSRKGGLGV